MKIWNFVRLVTAIAACTLSAAATPKWTTTHVNEVRLRDGVPGEEISVMRDSKEIETFLGYLKRGRKAGKNERGGQWPLCFDLVGERPERGRWLYDPAAGEFTRLDHFPKRVYRLLEIDRLHVNACFNKKETSQ